MRPSGVLQGSRRSNLARVSAAVALLTLVAGLAPPPLLAQATLVGKPLRQIRFEGLVQLAEESLRYYLGLEEGKPYDPVTLNNKIHDTWTNSQLLDNIQVEAEPFEDGVSLLITVEERPSLVSIEYQGLKKLNRGDIGDELDRQRIELYEGLPLEQGEVARLEAAIEKMYADRGYRFADVHVESETVGPGEVRLTVTVDEGGRVRIGRISFEGNEVFSSSKLRRQMKKTKKSGLITRIRKRDIYNPATVQEDLDNIKELYKTIGYKDIQVAQPEVEVVAKRPNAENPDDRKRRLALVVPIEEGSRWRLGDIDIEGNEVLEDPILRAAFEDPKGGWLRQDVIDKGLERIGEFYSNTGYIQAQVESEIREQNAEELIADVVVKVSEGDQYRVGRIEFSGNERTQDRVLRRELRLQEGMVFSAAALRNSMLKIQQLEFFELNEDEPFDVDFNEDKKNVNLVIKGTEAERTEVQFGGGYSEIDGFFAQAALRTRNFLGRGETLGFSLQTGRFRELFDLSYFVPWLLDRPQSVGAQLFKRDLDFDLIAGSTFVRNEQGAVLTYGRSFPLFHQISVSYTNSQFEDFQEFPVFLNPDPESGDNTITRDISFSRSSLTGLYVYDSHDSRLEPTRGKRLRFSVEYAGGPLGGEDYFIRPTLNLAYTRPLLRRGLRTVGRVNFEAGIIEPFGNDANGDPRELFFLNKFFLGGENSIRGFSFRSIWVRDPETGQTLLDESGAIQGGDKYWQLNLEHHFLTSGPFRVLVYFDAGNVYGEDQDFDPGHIRSSAGLELRINVPLFGAPLRFIWANNLDPLDLQGNDRERFESFDFSIGTSF